VKVQSSFQVDHGDNAQKTLKISLFGDWDRRDQHECVNPTHEEGEDRDHVHDTRVDALKLITGNECTGEPETKALNDNEPVINLNQEISREDSSGVNKFTADPVKPNVQSENEGNEGTSNGQVTGRETPPLPPRTPSNTEENELSNGGRFQRSVSFSKPEIKKEDRENTRYSISKTLDNAEENQVTVDSGHPLPDRYRTPRADNSVSSADIAPSNVQNENAPNPMKEPIGIPNKFATGDIEYRNHDTVVSKPIISIINFALGNSRSTIKKMALYG